MPRPRIAKRPAATARPGSRRTAGLLVAELRPPPTTGSLPARTPLRVAAESECIPTWVKCVVGEVKHFDVGIKNDVDVDRNFAFPEGPSPVGLRVGATGIRPGGVNADDGQRTQPFDILRHALAQLDTHERPARTRRRRRERKRDDAFAAGPADGAQGKRPAREGKRRNVAGEAQ